MTIASRPVVVTPTSAAFGVGVSQAPNPVFFGLRNRRRNTEPNGVADCDALTRWATPLGQAPPARPDTPLCSASGFFPDFGRQAGICRSADTVSQTHCGP